jgi:peptide-methionine (S)-S-oxide reductase
VRDGVAGGAAHRRAIADNAASFPARRHAMTDPVDVEVATLGGGCFWCLEAVFLEVDGVLGVESGYSNGHQPNPSYQQVCSGTTGHAEVVRVTFDPRRITFRELLEIFFVIHDPTTPNRQGSDVGTQYRSGIYTHGEEQERIAREVLAELASGGAVRGKEVYGRFPTVGLNHDDEVGSGSLLPGVAVDQIGGTLGKWFGVSDANLDFVFPNLRNFAQRDLGFMV